MEITDTHPIVLEPMSQQRGLITENDDWTGQSSTAERRKRQNRLNQRAYRVRKEKASSSISPCSSKVIRAPALRTLQANTRPAGIENQREHNSEPNSIGSDLWRTFYFAAGAPSIDFSQLAHAATLCQVSASPQVIISQFEKWVKTNYYGGSPATDQVIVLVKFNIFRAMIINSLALGFPAGERMHDDALSPFTCLNGPQRNLPLLPSTLRPTELQCQLPHHPWIDLLPIPGMRDNLLLAGDTYDDLQLCADLVGFFNSSTARTGMIIWGEAWDPNGWEVTPQFLEYWGWTIKGCQELFTSTNYWRLKRGERPLNFGNLIQGA